MLILTRTPAQALMIGNDVTLTVLNVKGDRVRIGINAPDSLRVQRAERPNPAGAAADVHTTPTAPPPPTPPTRR